MLNFRTFVLFDCLSVVWVSHLDSDLQCQEITFPGWILLLLLIYCFFVGKVALKQDYSTYKNWLKSEHEKCWKYLKMYSPRWVHRKSGAIYMNRSTYRRDRLIRSWPMIMIQTFLGNRSWFLEQLNKIALTLRCEEIYRAIGSQVVCLCCAELLKTEIMTGGRFSEDRRKVFNM